ncbi:MAG: DUF4363 family protein [Clostridiales bacterium]|nr:DUF4363 family protein [Clostridiales bacterium]
MKRFLMAVLALCLLLCACLCNLYYCRNMSDGLRRQLAEAVTLARAGEIDAALIAMERLGNEVERHILYLNVTDNHLGVDAIVESLTRALSCLREGELPEYYIECGLLESRFRQIYEADRINMSNVF